MFSNKSHGPTTIHNDLPNNVGWRGSTYLNNDLIQVCKSSKAFVAQRQSLDDCRSLGAVASHVIILVWQDVLINHDRESVHIGTLLLQSRQNCFALPIKLVVVTGLRIQWMIVTADQVWNTDADVPNKCDMEFNLVQSPDDVQIRMTCEVEFVLTIKYRGSFVMNHFIDA
jgi:hypothetical protein